MKHKILVISLLLSTVVQANAYAHNNFKNIELNSSDHKISVKYVGCVDGVVQNLEYENETDLDTENKAFSNRMLVARTSSNCYAKYILKIGKQVEKNTVTLYASEAFSGGDFVGIFYDLFKFMMTDEVEDFQSSTSDNWSAILRSITGMFHGTRTAVVYKKGNTNMHSSKLMISGNQFIEKDGHTLIKNAWDFAAKNGKKIMLVIPQKQNEYLQIPKFKVL